MTKTITAAGYIAYQDSYAIFGTGKTAEAAMQAAKAWTENGDTSALVTMPASEALMQAVDYQGGSIGWAEVNGVACTENEAI